MRSRVIGKCIDLIEVCSKKIREWVILLKGRCAPPGRKVSNLTEEYIIRERYAGEMFVKDFLSERTRNTMLNRYNIEVRTTAESIDEDTCEGMTTIGKVRLIRKKKIIDEATLITKKGEGDIIYWKFKQQ